MLARKYSQWRQELETVSLSVLFFFMTLSRIERAVKQQWAKTEAPGVKGPEI